MVSEFVGGKNRQDTGREDEGRVSWVKREESGSKRSQETGRTEGSGCGALTRSITSIHSILRVIGEVRYEGSKRLERLRDGRDDTLLKLGLTAIKVDSSWFDCETLREET